MVSRNKIIIKLHFMNISVSNYKIIIRDMCIELYLYPIFLMKFKEIQEILV